MTVQDVVDDAQWRLLHRYGINPGVGELTRLTGLGENDFSRRTFCLFQELSMDTSSGQTDYDLMSLDSIGDNEIVKVLSVTYNGEPLGYIIPDAFIRYPDYYDINEHYTRVTRTKIRLGFSPTTVTGGLVVVFSYTPEGSYTKVTDAMTLEDVHQEAVLNYVLWKKLFPDRRSEAYQKEYYGIVNTTRAQIEGMFHAA